MHKRTKILAAGVATTGILGLGGLGAAYAATTNNSGSNYVPIVEKIATTFNLNKDEVQSVFDEQRTENQKQRQQKIEDRLTQAVKDGKITEDQKTKLLAKLQEMHTVRENNRPTTRPNQMTDAERKAMHDKMEAERTAFKQWLTDNGITNLGDILPGLFGNNDHRGHYRMM